MNTKAILATSLLLPIAAHAAVDFVKEVQPILERNCVRCHTEKATAVENGDTNYILDTAKAAIRGRYIIPGEGSKSKVYSSTIKEDDDDNLMPPADEIKKGSSRRLSKEESEILKKWIDEGAKWPEGVTLIARKREIEMGASDRSFEFTSKLHKRIVESAMKAYSTTIIGSDVTFEMVPIPGGQFKMGSPEIEAGHNGDEGPQKEVSIEPFWMGKTEVTWDQFLLFMYNGEDRKSRETHQLTADELELIHDADEIANPSPPYVEMSFGMGTKGYPAISMTQHAANKFCQWLSARTGQFYRLPTEAEWEYAARAGSTTAYYWGDDASKLSEYAWWGKNSDFKYQKVGKKKPNPWGLYDMIGNVAEWTLDQYDPQYYGTMPASNPWNVATKPYPHSVRGGSWDDEDPAKLRIAARRGSSPEWKRQDPQVPKSIWFLTDAQFIGFRIVRPLKVPTAEEMHKYWNSGVEKDDPRAR